MSTELDGSVPRTLVEPPSPSPATIQPAFMNGQSQTSSTSPSAEGTNTFNSPDSSVPPTPGEKDADFINFTPKRRPLASFENLVALANHQERLKEARKMVWRDKGQPVVELDSLEDCFKHALSGGFRMCFSLSSKWALSSTNLLFIFCCH